MPNRHFPTVSGRRGKIHGLALIETVTAVFILSFVAFIALHPSDAKEMQYCMLHNSLSDLRYSIERYQADHENRMPDLSRNWDALTTATDAHGGRTGELHGPYMANPPVNPLTRDARVGSAPGKDVDWVWDSESGRIIPVNGPVGNET